MLRRRILLAVIAVTGTLMSSACAEESCKSWSDFVDPHPVMHDGSRALFWVRPLEVNADGARDAYHRDDPHGNKGLAIEYIGNGMTISRNGEPLEFNENEDKNGLWLDAYRTIVQRGWKPPRGWDIDIYGFARDASGNVCVKSDGRLVSATSLVQHPTARLCDPRRYVDALRLPGIVVPNRAATEKIARRVDEEVAPPFARNGVSRGDLAIVYNPETKIWRGAILYDTGPRDLLGEGSVRLVLDLRGQQELPKSAQETNSLGITETHVLLFPGTAKRLGPGRTWTKDKIQALASEQFRKWGGASESQALERLKMCADEYKFRYR